jgi:hypothetical protein
MNASITYWRKLLGVITQTITKAGTRIGLRIIGSVGREMAIQMPAASIRLWG